MALIPSANDVARFQTYFSGKRTAFGQTLLSPTQVDGQKRQASCSTVQERIAYDDYDKHLRGERGLGIIPIDEDDKCYFGAIDIDEYSGSQQSLVELIYKSHLPLVPFYSKSRGIHLFLFFREALPASTLIAFLKEIAQLLGIDRTFSTETKTMKATEIFPKQKSLADGSLGSWINLPYFGGDTRRIIAEDMQEVAWPACLDVIDTHRTTQKLLRALLDDMPFADGPPCLQRLSLQGVTQNRNNFLFSAARYFKAKLGSDSFEQAVRELNDSLPDPLDDSELEGTVLASNRKQDYCYKCSDVPLCSICEEGGLKETCKKRKYGVGGSVISELSFGRFIQVLSDPPYYLWDVTGRGTSATLKFYDEQDIMKQEEFRKQVFRHLLFFPSRLKEDVWQTIVNNALLEIEKQGAGIQGSSEGEMSLGSMFRDLVKEFIKERKMLKDAPKAQMISMRKVYKEEELEAYLFTTQAFIDFIVGKKQFRAYKQTELGVKLKEMGAMMISYNISESKPKATLWALPYASVPNIDDEKNLFEESLAKAAKKGVSNEKSF